MTKQEALEKLRRYQYRTEPVWEVRFRAKAEAQTGGYPAIQMQLRAPNSSEALSIAKTFVRTGSLRDPSIERTNPPTSP